MADDSYKRPGDELESDQSKRSRTGDAESGYELDNSGSSFDDVKLTLRVLVDDVDVGGLIGKGGVVINKLRTETGCRIDVETSVRDVRDRVVTIVGPVTKLVGLLVTVAQKCAPREKKRDDLSITILVDNSAAGGLIGKAGSKINETRRNSGATIRISSQPLEGSSEKTVQVSGDSKKISSALETIIYQILAEPDKAPRKPYVPVPEYDDYRGPPPFYDRRDRWGPDGPYGPPRMMRGPPRRGPPFGSPGPYGPPPTYGAPPPPFTSRPPRPSFDGPSVTVTMPVSDALIGGIIGRGGYKINDIRQRSGAQIKVTPSSGGSSDRKIIITGPQPACDLASQLINERIKEQQEDRALQQQ
jgi:predicted PilT family ATPase